MVRSPSFLKTFYLNIHVILEELLLRMSLRSLSPRRGKAVKKIEEDPESEPESKIEFSGVSFIFILIPLPL